MKSKLSFIKNSMLLSSLFLLSSCMMMSPSHLSGDHHLSNNQNHTITNSDPVCGNSIDYSTSTLTYQYNNEIHYFDSNDCLNEFKQSPDKYMKNYRNQNNHNGMMIGLGVVAMTVMMTFMIF